MATYNITLLKKKMFFGNIGIDTQLKVQKDLVARSDGLRLKRSKL